MAVLPMNGGDTTHLQPFKFYITGYSGDIWWAFHDFDKRYTKVKLVSSTAKYSQFRYYPSQGATQTVISMTVGTTYDIPSEYYDGTLDNLSGLIFVIGNAGGVALLEFS